MVLCVQVHQNHMTGIGASQKKKDLSRLLYRICGCGSISGTKLDFQKVQRVRPFTVLENFRFLSLRYSAYFRRSRLVFFQIR